MPLKGLPDRVVIVTGGANGIGRATAERLAAEGCRVAVVDIDGEAAAAVADGLEGEAIGVAGDVSREEDVIRYFGEVAERFGRVDALHNNAGIEGPVSPLADFATEEFDRLVAVNLRGCMLNLREMLRLARRDGRPATIVNTASGAGMHGVPGLGAYGATKAAIIHLTRAAAVESSADGTRVNAVAPGPVDTALFGRLDEGLQEAAAGALPAGRVGTVGEVAALVAFLLSDEAPFVTGSIVSIDGGEMA